MLCCIIVLFVSIEGVDIVIWHVVKEPLLTLLDDNLFHLSFSSVGKTNWLRHLKLI